MSSHIEFLKSNMSMKIETSSPTIEIITGQILSEIEQYMLRINVQFPISDDVTNFYEVYVPK
jgi:hypothetical protein